MNYDSIENTNMMYISHLSNCHMALIFTRQASQGEKNNISWLKKIKENSLETVVFSFLSWVNIFSFVSAISRTMELMRTIK